jgi:transposase
MDAIILPDATLFTMLSYSVDEKILNIEICTKAKQGICPDCQQKSSRVHSHYDRTVRDLPVSAFSVVLNLTVRRYFCDNPDCERCTFVERMPGAIETYARRTARLVASQREVGFLAGGETGAKIVRKLALPTSPDTLIRLVRNAPMPERPTPKILGIDDWAFRRGHSYGTILVDLETRRPIELLPDRSFEVVSKWLLEHPGVEIVSRDRSTSYIQSIQTGAPNAIQVADRWHLLHNLVEAIERSLTRRYKVLQDVFRETFTDTSMSESQTANFHVKEPAETAKKPTYSEQLRQQVRDKHQAQFDEIHRLRKDGHSIRAISRKLRIGRDKIRKYLANAQPPEYKRSRQKTNLTPFWGYIKERWIAGHRNGMALWKEIREMGYTGTYHSLAKHIVPLRKEMPREKKPKLLQKQTPSLSSTKQVRPFSVRQTAWLFVKDRQKIDGDKAKYLDQLLAKSDDFQRLSILVHQFWQIVKERKKEHLNAWIPEAKNSGIVELKNFAQGLEKDLKAIEAALTYEWSNGPVEGHNNRLKMIKRQMYGRAKFDLLRQRVLYTA